jgi:uncharacterized hydrophobic protein (TIGR00271 family)
MTLDPEVTAVPRSALPLGGAIPSWRNAAARALGVDAARREQVVVAMLERHAREAVQYWLQLLLAMGIATMGLVLNSTAVVIGAMLISPLMGPIVELGMGLVVGSAFLVLRAGARVLGSVAVVVASAAAITLTLPFHELTSEIAARTTPTLLDLLVAVFCALAAAFTAVRDTSESTSAAAGTAIGIALVPPLCVIGYGLGTWHTNIARGASLLFTANLSAIVLFAVLVFLVLGFEATPIRALEDGVLSGERATHRTERVAGALRRVFGARYGTVLRLSMPLVLVAAVFVPLRRALEEVAWQVRVRTAIRGLLRDSTLTRNAVRSFVAVEHHAVDVRLVVVAQPEDAAALERDLRARILRASAVEPTVDVVAVPDYRTLRQTVVALERPSLAPEPPRPPDLEEVRSRVARGIADVWPRDATGRVLSWGLTFPPRRPPRIEIVHLGPPLGPGTEALLSRAFETERGLSVSVQTTAVPAAPVDASPGEGERWLPSLVRAVDVGARHDALFVCASIPAPTEPAEPGAARLVEAVREELDRLAPTRTSLLTADRWSVRVGVDPCPSANVDGADGGVAPGDASTLANATTRRAP